MKSADVGVVAGLAAVGLGAFTLGVSVFAWITHVIACIQAGAWVLLAFGCIFAPVGVIHGIGLWLGAF